MLRKDGLGENGSIMNINEETLIKRDTPFIWSAVHTIASKFQSLDALGTRAESGGASAERQSPASNDALNLAARWFRRGGGSRSSFASNLTFARSALDDFSSRSPGLSLHNQFDPVRRQALRFLGQSALVGGALILNQDFAAAFQEVEGEAQGRLKDMRLKVAHGQERADLTRRWNKSNEREDLSKWFKDEGYDRLEDGLEYILVFDRNKFVRSAAAQIWKKGGKKRGGVYLSLDGSKEEWYGITYNNEDAKTLLKVKKKGEVKESKIRSNSSVASAAGSVSTERQDSAGCDACEVGCTVAGTGWLVVSAAFCYMQCGVAMVAEPAEIGSCVGGCTLYVAVGGTAGIEKCPDICDAGGFC